MAELVRRLDGRSVGEVLAQDVLGDPSIEAFIGLPEALHGRVADTIPPPLDLSQEPFQLADEANRKAQALIRAVALT